MKYRDENGKFCSKEKWESLQKNERNKRIPWPTVVTLIVICAIMVYEVWEVSSTGWWQ